MKVVFTFLTTNISVSLWPLTAFGNQVCQKDRRDE